MAIGVEEERKLKGIKGFKRQNPKSDLFDIRRFHHLEFWALDATSTAKRLQTGLGMTFVAKSDLSTENSTCVSQVIKSNEVVFVVTAPQPAHVTKPESQCALPGYNADVAFEFLKTHGLAVRAIGLSVGDAAEAHRVATQNGANSALEPTTLVDKATGKRKVISEVQAYGDVVLRFVSGDFEGPFLPNYAPVDAPYHCYGLQRMDHCVGNAPRLFEVTDYLSKMLGFHEFAEFTTQDVGTVDSGLNSMVLANNSEMVLLPVNEPTHGTKRKSQIQTYLEHNAGPGVQHLALKTDDIFTTLRKMREVTDLGGMDFMARTSAEYYKNLPNKIGDALTAKQFAECEELGILVDKDDQGILLQIFTRPISDRPTFFFEIIQRIGCEEKVQKEVAPGKVEEVVEQAGGCGGFGKGNFSELFKSIEKQFETELGE